MRKIIFSFVFLFSILFLVNCGGKKSDKTSDSQNKLSGKISISGAFALYPMAVKWAEEYQKLYPDIVIDISACGAGKGMTDVLSNMVDLAMVSREIVDEEKKKGAYEIAVVKDAVLPTINEKNPVLKELMEKGMKREQFIDIFITKKLTTWGNVVGTSTGTKINVFTRSDACGAAEMWGKYLGKTREALQGIQVFGDPGIADAVRNDVNSIGYNNLMYCYDIKNRKKYSGMEVIPIDINENGKIDADEKFYDSLDSLTKAIADDKYPSPPARDLFFVSNGKTTNPLVIHFIKWILTEGQKFVKEAGYVQLPEAKISVEQDKLK